MPLSKLIAPLVEHSRAFAEKPTLERTVLGGLGGLGLSQIENNTILDDTDPHTQSLNRVLGTGTGVGLGLAAKNPEALAPLAAGYVLKSLGLLGYDAAKKYINIQQPIAEKNLQTAGIQNDTAKLLGEQAQHLRPLDYASMGLAGAGLGAAGGLGYYLWKEHGPGKKPAPTQRMKVTLPIGANSSKGSVEIDSPMDPVDMSKNLYKELQRDKRRRLLLEARLSTMHRKKAPVKKMAPEETTKEASYSRAPQLEFLNSVLDCLV